MWQLENGVWKETGFPFFNFVTTRVLGNMRDAQVRGDYLRGLKIDPESLVTAQQVHGNVVALTGGADAGHELLSTDGMLTASPGVALAVFTADCLPVFLADKNKKAAGIVHAGWRGLDSGILGAAIDLFVKEYGVGPEEISAAIGPHIQKCCYETGPELRERFGISSSDKNLDLSAIAREQLNKRGVKNISVCDQCTCHESFSFFSYRKDKTDSRIMSLIRI